MGTCNICLESLLQRSPEADTQKQGTEEAAGTANLSSLVSATPCGHVFHTVCVTQWLQQEEQHPLGQQQQHCCPQCRRPVSVGTLVKLFLDHEGSDSGLGGKDGNKRPKQRKRTGNTNKKEKIVVRTKVNLPGSSGSSDRGSSEDVRERLIRSEREKEENRIIQVKLLAFRTTSPSYCTINVPHTLCNRTYYNASWRTWKANTKNSASTWL